ncbi:sensor histidine kinase [Massilia cavernae]|uniref:histidine kinase n=1 Tax=Massilia cavernae TaxID=2320864 RepID=A0A418X7J5_9BURK|nr:sensor histidine kinase [Massilia cavernae]RJG08378.1 sensor histidine kinase [Massilia cavernae]
MASDPQRLVVAGSVLLAGAALFAGVSYDAGGALALAGSGLAALMSVVLIRHGTTALIDAARVLPVEVPVGIPHDRQQLAATVLALESQLEHAPIALFSVIPSHTNSVEPVNASARRLLAPGRASDAEALRNTLAALAAGQRSVIEFDTERGAERALASAASITVEGTPQRLVALMPVENELAAEAMHAWQKLVHVLTHEIMNSLTPVASLSHTSRELLAGVRPTLPSELADDLDLALDAISRRADSLAHFVGGYRALASVPEARPQRVAVAALFARLSALVAPSWQARGGLCVFSVEPASLELMADPGQLEQAIVNLLKNAEEATGGLAAPEVHVSAKFARGGRLRFEVCDNGPGVPDDVIADIFTPFFSTRKRGSGIGLAMVRQLVHRNGGAVRYAKSVGGGARFVVTF